MDTHSSSQANDSQAVSPLNGDEIRLILNATVDELSEFARTPRIKAADLKGDTPLHLVARMGKLALCDLLVRAGSDLRAKNFDCETPAETAAAEGHALVAQLLAMTVSSRDTRNNDFGRSLIYEVGEADHNLTSDDFIPHTDQINERSLDDFFAEPTEDAESFFTRTHSSDATGLFAPSRIQIDTGHSQKILDWQLDLSAGTIVGDGLGTIEHGSPTKAPTDDQDFLKVQRGGRGSTKTAVAVADTRISIATGLCFEWAENIVDKGYFDPGDLNEMIFRCEGNAGTENLRANVVRTLEGEGLPFSGGSDEEFELIWDAKTGLTADHLASGLEAAFSRATRLPGMNRFQLSKRREKQILDQVLEAKSMLHLEILGCLPAVDSTLSMIEAAFEGRVKAADVTMRQFGTESDDRDAAEVREAFTALQTWRSGGCVLEGKQRRYALRALETLDLTLAFQRELVRNFARESANTSVQHRFHDLIADYENAINELIFEHLSFARRFASRNVIENEELEDLFQVAVLGLFRAARRFEPRRGNRFSVYSMAWMKQTLLRWRAAEKSLIRIPVHRQPKLAELDAALFDIERKIGKAPSADELQALLKWDLAEIERLMDIPRTSVSDCLINEDDSHGAAEFDIGQALDMTQMCQTIEELLAELPSRQAEVLRMRFGLNGGDEMTLEEVGQQLGVTRQRVQQLEAKALDQLSHPIRKRRLQSLLGI